MLFIDEIHRLQPGGRRNPLSRDGGFPSSTSSSAQRPLGPFGEERARTLHADRRDHAVRPSHYAVARPFRDTHPALLLRDWRVDRDRRARRPRCWARRSPKTAPAKSRCARRGTPRIAGRLLKRVCAISASVAYGAEVDQAAADAALARSEVDKRGLDAFDRRYLALIAEGFNGGPVGIETISRRAWRIARRHRGDCRALFDPAELGAAYAARTVAGQPSLWASWAARADRAAWPAAIVRR